MRRTSSSGQPKRRRRQRCRRTSSETGLAASPRRGSGDVERVRPCARRMRRAVVERVEVVVDRLDLRALHHGEAEPKEDVFELAPRLPSAGAGGRSAAVARRAASRRRGRPAAVASQLRPAELRSPRASISASSAWLSLVGGLTDGSSFCGLELRRRRAASAAARPCARDSERASCSSAIGCRRARGDLGLALRPQLLRCARSLTLVTLDG